MWHDKQLGAHYLTASRAAIMFSFDESFDQCFCHAFWTSDKLIVAGADLDLGLPFSGTSVHDSTAC